MILKADVEANITIINPNDITTIVNGYRTITILGGEFVIIPSSDDVSIKTLLGSCVAMMFYDTKQKVIGMNHFLLPDTQATKDSLKFGLYSVETMLNEMYKMGSKKEDLIVKIAGGAHVLNDSKNRIGDKNIDFALDFCKQEGIEVVSQHTRGDQGRIILLTNEFKTYIRIVKNKAIEAEIESSEKVLYKKSKISSSGITLF